MAVSHQIKTMRKKIITALLVFCTITSIGAVGAQESNYDTVYVGNATEMGVNSTYTFDTIENATNNVASNGSVEIQNGTYMLNESVNVTTSNITVSAYNETNVTINATETKNGTAFIGPESDTLTVDEHITVEGNIFVGGGSGVNTGSSLNNTYYGIPLWGILVIILALAYVYYEFEYK